jgi:hypothetical protein
VKSTECRKSSREKERLTISHQLSDLLVLSAGDLDIVDCHHDSEELLLWSAGVLIKVIFTKPSIISCALSSFPSFLLVSAQS